MCSYRTTLICDYRTYWICRNCTVNLSCKKLRFFSFFFKSIDGSRQQTHVYWNWNCRAQQTASTVMYWLDPQWTIGTSRVKRVQLLTITKYTFSESECIVNNVAATVDQIQNLEQGWLRMWSNKTNTRKSLAMNERFLTGYDKRMCKCSANLALPNEFQGSFRETANKGT